MNINDVKMHHLFYILRWGAVLPGALLSAFAAMFPIHWLVMLQYLDSDMPDYDAGDMATFLSPQSLEALALAFFTPLVFITVGSRVAPRFKFFTGIALAALLGIFYGWVATVVVEEIQQGIYTPANWLRLGVTVLLCMAGLAIGLFQAHKADQ